MPVIIQIEKEHLRLSGFQDSVSELLNLETCLERKLKFRAFDHNVREIKQVNFERVEHAFPSYDDLLWLLFYWETSDQCGYFLSCLPFCKLTETFLSCPYTSMDDLQEELSRLRIEDENCSVDWFRGQVAFERLVDCDSVDVGVINEPNDLIREYLSIVL